MRVPFLKTGLALAVAVALLAPGSAEAATGKLTRLAAHDRARLVCGTDSEVRVVRVRDRQGRVMRGRVVAYGSGIVWRRGRARVTLDRHAGLVVSHSTRASVRWRCD